VELPAGPATGGLTGHPATLQREENRAEHALDADVLGVRGINQALRTLPPGSLVRVSAPRGRHNLAVGLATPLTVTVEGNAGYYLGGLCGTGGDGPRIEVEGFVGSGVAENLMGGSVLVRGCASSGAAASARGGMVVVEGDASLRAGISLKGATLAVAGDVGAMAGFMAQAGTILVGGDAGPGLGDSLYEAVIYVAGRIASLGADAQLEELSEHDVLAVKHLVEATGFDHIDPAAVTKVASARRLYHFSSQHASSY
jgi:glutamate synthase domain-containing protein 3